MNIAGQAGWRIEDHMFGGTEKRVRFSSEK